MPHAHASCLMHMPRAHATSAYKIHMRKATKCKSWMGQYSIAAMLVTIEMNARLMAKLWLTHQHACSNWGRKREHDLRKFGSTLILSPAGRGQQAGVD